MKYTEVFNSTLDTKCWQTKVLGGRITHMLTFLKFPPASKERNILFQDRDTYLSQTIKLRKSFFKVFAQRVILIMQKSTKLKGLGVFLKDKMVLV